MVMPLPETVNSRPMAKPLPEAAPSVADPPVYEMYVVAEAVDASSQERAIAATAHTKTISRFISISLGPLRAISLFAAAVEGPAFDDNRSEN